jgi:hypothetical protein
LSADLGLAIHDICSPAKSQSFYEKNKTSKIKNVQTMLMRHVQSQISETSFDLRTGAIPNTKAYIKVIVTACMSKQHAINIQSRAFCEDFAVYMTKTQNKPKFALNGFMRMQPDESDMPNLVQSISFRVPVMSRTLNIFHIHNLGRLHNGTLQTVFLPTAAVLSDQIRAINLDQCEEYKNRMICSEGKLKKLTL